MAMLPMFLATNLVYARLLQQCLCIYFILLLSPYVFLLARETLKNESLDHISTPQGLSSHFKRLAEVFAVRSTRPHMLQCLLLLSSFSSFFYSLSVHSHEVPGTLASPCCSSVTPARLRTLIQTAVCAQNACPTDSCKVSTLIPFSFWSNEDLLYPSARISGAPLP